MAIGYLAVLEVNAVHKPFRECASLYERKGILT